MDFFDHAQKSPSGVLLGQVIGAQIQNIFEICARARLQGPSQAPKSSEV